MRQTGVGASQYTRKVISHYRYVRVGSYYINSQLTLTRLSTYLWQQFDQFLGSEGKTSTKPSPFTRMVPPTLVKAGRISKVLLRFLLARSLTAASGESNEGRSITLEVGGDFAIVRKSGAVKVLDMEGGTVHTMMGPRDREKLGQRVELSREVERFAFAPRLKNVDLDRGIFSEEFISGSHPLNFEGCRDDFGAVYLPLLVEFLAATTPRWRRVPEYVEALTGSILASDGLLQQLDEESRRSVVNLVTDISQRLKGLQEEIPLVLSHGDYFSGNVVIEPGKYRAIDWANMGYRSPLHDLYYLQMNHCGRIMGHETLERRMEAAVQELRQGLRRENSDRFSQLARYLTTNPIYRYLFYLECIEVPLVRCSSAEDRYLKSMLVRVSWFQSYEQGVDARLSNRPRSATEDDPQGFFCGAGDG